MVSQYGGPLHIPKPEKMQLSFNQVDDVIEKNKINVTLRGTGQHKSLFLYLIISRTLRRQKGTEICGEKKRENVRNKKQNE